MARSSIPSSLLCIFSILLSLRTTIAVTPSVVKAVYWFPNGELDVSDIDSTLFTHVLCAFADLDPNSNQVTISSDNAQVFSSFTSTLQQKNPDVYTLLSIGGGASKPQDFSTMASQSSSRQAFISSSIQIARDNDFYGLDLDWEFPEGSDNMINFATLLTEWRAAVDTEASSSGKTPLLLTAAVYYSATRNSETFPVNSINTNLDWVNVMNYDYQGPGWRPATTYAPAALHDPSSSVDTATGISAWIKTGLPRGKIALGMPFYGRAWTLVDPNDNGIGAAANGPATGTGIDSGGALTYRQINTFIKDNGATKVYNSSIVTNYCYAGTTWIGYDDVESINEKVSFARSNGLLGYFAWSVGGDDNFVLSKTAYSKWESS